MKELKSHIDYTPILRRIQNGDLSVASIELGKSITYQEHEGFIPLGVQECDTIAIEEKSGEIVLLDHEVSGRIMGLIANNLISFIYALCEIEEHFEKCEENEDLYDDEAFMIASARRAGHLAGGDRYASFYSNLFGI